MITKPFVIPLHFILVFLVYLIMMLSQIIVTVPNDQNILAWDASWYHSIKTNGYVYLPGRTCNMAFFPLFPMLWKLLTVNGIGIAVINLIIFACSFAWLIKATAVSRTDLLLLLSLPSLIFCFLPYSEALFFLFGVITIKGLDSGARLLTCIGLMGCCLTRSASAVFVPALIIVMIVEWRHQHRIIADTVIYCTICIACIFLVAFMQASTTGLWFYFLKVQIYWDRQWIIPGLPFTTFSPGRILKYDATALLIGMISIYFSIKFFFSRTERVAPSVLFSLLCMAGITVLDVCFTHNRYGHGNLWSLNRHLLCAPFMTWLLIWFWRKYQLRKMDVYFISGITLACLVLTGIPGYFLSGLYFVCFATTYILLKFSWELNRYRLVMYVINLVLQTYLFAEFLEGKYVA